MPVPRVVTKVNKTVLNKGMRHLAGHGWFVELEHVGRRTGRTFHVPLMAFERGDLVTVALTYGRSVDWLANLRAAGGGRLHLGRELLSLGPPRDLPADEGLARMPQPPRTLLPLLGCEDWVELPVFGRSPWQGW